MGGKELRQNDGLLFKDEVYKIVSAALEVSNQLGCGFLQEALALEFAYQRMPHQQQAHIKINYKDWVLEKGYTADFVCYEQIVVEIKAIKTITVIEEAQMLNYLRATRLPLGLLINFGTTRLQWKRYAHTRSREPQINANLR